MQKQIQIKLFPHELEDPSALRREVLKLLKTSDLQKSSMRVVRRTIDARSKTPYYLLTVEIFTGESSEPVYQPRYREVHQASHQVLIAGSGPSALFAALRLIEGGIRPVILERGKDIQARRRDLATLNKEGKINPDSNYCFGAGGAGTYSDGKLYTRSVKRGDTQRILSIFRYYGAPEAISYDAHPHIGTNKLPAIIASMTSRILEAGGEIHYDQRVTDLVTTGDFLKGVITSRGDRFQGSALILSTGHSARDIFQMLHSRGLRISPKPFALGVRVEHPQELIDQIQYHCPDRGLLPPASYSLVERLGDRSAFSFCMCPGGIIAPSATAPEELVVNGWSPSKRNNPFANSGIVVEVGPKDWKKFEKWGPLSAVQFQSQVEQIAFRAGGGSFVAPAQRMTDFVRGKLSVNLPECSYLPGLKSALLSEVLPGPVYEALSQAFLAFGRKKKGYFTEESVVVAPESRTSSPVQVTRDPVTLQHPQLRGLYPCGEGAGYAGGIMSAAMDGERCAGAVLQWLEPGRA